MTLQWELVTDNHADQGYARLSLYRIPVPGGWLYRTLAQSENGRPKAELAFVPAPQPPGMEAARRNLENQIEGLKAQLDGAKQARDQAEADAGRAETEAARARIDVSTVMDQVNRLRRAATKARKAKSPSKALIGIPDAHRRAAMRSVISTAAKARRTRG